MSNLNGIINVLKPAGMTSSDAVARIRGVLKEKRVGHLGTLDPLASGVLPIAVGKSTRLFDVFLTKQKHYRAFFDFRYETDTLDSDGVIGNRSDRSVTEDEIREVLPKFIGEIDQIPPLYSAKCVDGTRAYKLARNNVQVELKASRVEIFDIKLLGKHSETCFVLDIHCSSGTYIRSLVRDIAKEMGVFGYMAGLIRLQSGNFHINEAVTFEELEVIREKAIVEPEKTLMFLPMVTLENDSDIKYIANGLARIMKIQDGLYRIYFKETFAGLAVAKDGRLAMQLNFLT